MTAEGIWERLARQGVVGHTIPTSVIGLAEWAAEVRILVDSGPPAVKDTPQEIGD